eukprot:1376556-Amorphochlora_amoeboformis.AAC.1
MDHPAFIMPPGAAGGTPGGGTLGGGTLRGEVQGQGEELMSREVGMFTPGGYLPPRWDRGNLMRDVWYVGI